MVLTFPTRGQHNSTARDNKQVRRHPSSTRAVASGLDRSRPCQWSGPSAFFLLSPALHHSEFPDPQWEHCSCMQQTRG